MRLKVFSTTPKNISRISNPKLILLDYFPFPHWIGLSSIAARTIQEKTGNKILAFGFVKPFKETRDLYKAFGISNHLQIKLRSRQMVNMWKLFSRITASIELPEDVYNLEIDGIKIGIPIYESILRNGKITVDTEDIETFKQVYLGLLQYVFFEKLFSMDQIEAILVSHDCYIGPGLLDHLAHQFGVPSINVNPLEINLPFKAQQLYQRFERYPEYFAALPLKTKNLGIAQSKFDLDSRLSGMTGIKMGYQEESAFENSKLQIQLAKSGDLKVLVATHDFYDNPQAYGEMLFHDFSIWLDFINTIASDTTYDWYLKCHKDSSIRQKQEIQEFSLRNPRFKLVDSAVSFHQLAEEGLAFVLTCYGSVGHELPLLGINVLNSSYNPHVAYNFNYHAKSVANYRELILKLEELNHRSIPTSQIYEFFYVHHYLMWPDNFIFPSYSDYLRITDNRLQSGAAIAYMVDNYEEIVRNLRMQFEIAMRERRVFSIESILKPQEQLRHPLTSRNRFLFERFSS